MTILLAAMHIVPPRMYEAHFQMTCMLSNAKIAVVPAIATSTPWRNQELGSTCESADGSAGVPPMVDTTASTSSICSKAFLTSSLLSASPRTRMAIIPSISPLHAQLTVVTPGDVSLVFQACLKVCQSAALSASV